MGSRTTFSHAQARDALRAQLQQVRRRQFVGGDNGAGRHVVVPGFAKQRAQHPLPEVAQIVGALGQQRAAGVLQYLALRVDGLAPGVGRRRAGFN